MARYCQKIASILVIFVLVICVESIREGFKPDILHINELEDTLRPRIISKSDFQNDFGGERHKRDTNNNPNETITNNDVFVKVNPLKDSHAQLMVHWLGYGSNVMICLARDPPLSSGDSAKLSADISPSSVYFSYDYGDTFINKTDLFKVKIGGKSKNAILDQFLTHPKFDTIIFTDSRNKAIFHVPHKGDDIDTYMLHFTPSDISFYENDPNTFLAHDKESPDRNLYYTTDAGITFSILQTYVKSFSWYSGEDMPTHLYVERKEPTNSSSIIFINADDLLSVYRISFNLLIENVQDFHIKNDFMFAIRKVINTTQLWISYKRGPFVKADFQTELDIKGLHICDVEGTRILLSAAHSDVLSHLYVSESSNNMATIKFIPSLENIFTYIPNIIWTNGWIVQTTDEAFTDLYKVEGVRGVYIASKVVRSGVQGNSDKSVGPEHLVSLITYNHGVNWQPIKAPKLDDEKQPITCGKDCSLHLSQKFCQLYPVTRSVTIMSSKLAPGVIMASGVIGKSMKGHPGVYLSRDAGLTWTQILKTYHVFNFGDHGGILVAVKYFKSKGETREVIYSTDEGDTWKSQKFHSNDLKIYGLMTEPNSNTTIFTLFGSEKAEHKWLIIKLDLKKAFERNCTEADYKFWTPSSKSDDSLVPCVLGVQTTFQRRIAHTNCYNGVDYKRIYKTETCVCNKWDFECDFGFSRANSNSHCTFNKSLLSVMNPFEIPKYCKPGRYYNRTRGYKKIEGDACVAGFENRYLPQQIPCPVEMENNFLLIAQRDRISRIDLNTFKKDELPVQKLHNVITIDFDMKNNCVFFADIISDNIARQCLNGTKGHENLVDTNLASVEGMSYDWISEMLFFVDGTRSKIEAVKTSNDHLFRMRTIIVDSKDLIKPRGIVVHPIEGYLFWTEWSTQKPSLSRCNLDGSDIKELFTKPTVVWPNGITIDYFAQRLYWVDASKDYIGSCDLNGDNFMKVIEQDNRVDHPFAVAVYKDQMFWDDWKMNLIFSADKDHGVRIQNISQQMTNLMDLKVYAHSLQVGKNGCEENNCSHICVGAPRGKFSCLCPEGMIKSTKTNDCLCPGGEPPFKNQTCAENGNTCGPGFFTCANKLCISNAYRCDSHDDCGDKSDEQDCALINPSCDPQMFTCKSDGKCIPEYFVCDFDIDCIDGSDEVNCTHTECKDDEFTCTNGRCVTNRWKCDGEDDCRDGSDEKDCPQHKFPVECKAEDFHCKSNGQCIPYQWRCDNELDCRDGSDELDCQNKKCDSWEFSCGNGKCIYRTWKCDGDVDCDNGEDEVNCTKVVPSTGSNNFFPSVVCHDWMFKCANNKCIPIWWKCDKVNDCGDDSDEFGCSNNSRNDTNLISTTPKPNDVSPTKKMKCFINQFECNSGSCISKRYVCDGTPDCSNGEDEVNCPPISRDNCGVNHFRCVSDQSCLPKTKYCDGIVQCADGSDEQNCDKPATLKPEVKINCIMGFFTCDNKCHPLLERCDKKLDCYDGSDEENCETFKRVYQVTNYVVDNKFLNATSFVLVWWLSLTQQDNNLNFEYLPTISVTGKNIWTNHTTWITEKRHLFAQLVPHTTYNVTVYARVKGENAAPPCFYTNVTTGAGIPTEPLNFKAVQINGTRIRVDWDPPLEPYGKLISYNVYYRPQSISMEAVKMLKVSSFDTSAIIESPFKGNVTYDFWVRAKNSQHESPASKMVQLTFNDISNMDIPKGIAYSYDKPKHILTLTWNPVTNADGYIISIYLPQPYPTIPSIKTNNTDYKFHNLVSGAQYTFKVFAYIGSYVGRPKVAKYTTSGTPLPEVKTRLQHDTDRVTLLWTEPKTDLKNLTYGVYYGTSIVELCEKPRIITQNKEVNLTDLMPCESYLISVGIVGPNGPGPLTHNPITLETSLNDKKPPKNLTATINPKTRYLIINWEHNCPISKSYPPYYLTVTETVLNKTVSIVFKQSSNKTFSHYFKNIPFGALYNVSVKANIKDAESASIMVPAPSLEGPRQLKVWPERNGSFVVYWKELDTPYDFGFTYEVAIFRGILSNLSLNNIVTVNVFQSKVPPIIVNPEDLGESKAVGQAFTFGIRVKSDEGYASEISETENIEFTQRYALQKEVASSSSNFWLIIIPMALIASLVGVIVVLVQRHRRLQTSFSRFANSHYDTKTGATRICDTLEDEDSMQHQRDPTRFADDEPLVIT